MSWSVSFMGESHNVADALNKHVIQDKNSASEYEAAKPHLVALVLQNFTPEPEKNPLVKIEANGHGSFYADGTPVNRNFTVKLERLYGELV